MLSPQDRQKLDGIVLKMSENNESPADIQFVVDDFKKKYENQVVTPAQQVSKGPETLMEKAGGFVKDVARDITKPVVQTLAAPAQLAAYGIDKATGGNSPVEDFSFTMPFWGEISPAKTKEEAVGRGVQTVALGLGPVSGGAAFMGGQAMTENKGVGGVALDTIIGGFTGKVGEVATKAVGTVLSKSGKAMQTAGAGYDALINSAKKNYETVLGPTTKANKRITQQITGELAERQVTATTRQELWDKAAGQVEKYGEQIQEFYKSLPEDTKVKTDGILKAIDATKRKLFVKGEGAYMVPEVNKALFKKYQDLQIEIMSMAKNGNAPIEGVRALRQALDKSIAKTTSTFGITGEESIITEARKGVSNILRNELAKQFPDVAVINKEFTFWSRVQQVLGDTIERKVGQGTPLGEKIMTAAGGAAGIGSGGVSTGISTAIGIKYLYQLTKSTAWQTLAASMKTKLANALVEGDGMTFSKVMNDILKASGYVIEKTGNILKATPEVLKNAPRKDIPGTSRINLKQKTKTALDNVKRKGGLSIEDVSKKKVDEHHIFDGLVKNIKRSGSGINVDELNPVDFSSFEDSVKTKKGRETVDYIKKQILSGKNPAIEIKSDKSGKVFVEDGHHTVQAYKELGYNNIPIEKNNTTTVLENPLLREIRKYKSAEEFVKAVTEDRGGVGAGVEYSPWKRRVETGINDTPLTKFGFKPDEKITIYRGVDRASQSKIQDGDYIALSHDLAKSYTGGRVISEKVPASSIRLSSGDGLTAADFKDRNGLHIEAVYNPNEPIKSSQLTDIWNKAHQSAPEQSLLNEARKYKSAEEFVKAQPKVYHGGTADIKAVDMGKSNFSKTFYISDNADYAKSFGGNKSFLNEMVLDPKANLADMRKPSEDLIAQIDKIAKGHETGKTITVRKPDGSYLGIPETANSVSFHPYTREQVIQGLRDGKAHFAELPEVKKILKDLGYDGQITAEVPYAKNIGVWNKDKIYTKSQLTDIWKKVNKGKTRIDTIIAGAAGTGALAAGVAGVKTLQNNSLNGKTFENKKLGTTILDGKSDAPAVKESDGISQNQLNIGDGEKAKNEVIATVVAEAIGEGDEGMQIVLNTINNRASEKKKTMHQVVKDPAQFSAYGNELFKKVMGLLNGSPTPFKDATEKMFIEKAVKKVRELIESGKIEDLTNGATHYWNPNTAKKEKWMDEGEYTLKKGKHVFKKGIRYSVRD